MFAVNGPTGPTSRHERRVRDDTPTKEQLDAQRAVRESFFKDKSKSTASSEAQQSTSKEVVSEKENDAPQIFKGCRIYFNGRTGNISSYYLTKLVQQHGGNMAREYKVTRVTHIVACNLSGSKADKLIKSCGKIKCVRPEWILQSVKQGKKLPEFDFLVYKDASSNVMATAFASNHTAAKPPTRP